MVAARLLVSCMVVSETRKAPALNCRRCAEPAARKVDVSRAELPHFPRVSCVAEVLPGSHSKSTTLAAVRPAPAADRRSNQVEFVSKIGCSAMAPSRLHHRDYRG